MASYHLRIKTSSKKNGKKTKSTEHLDYIARKGKYEKFEQKEIRQLDENFIYADGWNKDIPDINTLLYKSNFGEIYISPKGLQVTDNASIQTIIMALEVAKKIFSGNLILKGNQNFIGKTIIAAANSDTKIKFKDTKIQNLIQKETEKNGKYIGTGESSREYRFTDFNSIYQQYAEPSEATIFSEPPFTSGRNALSILPSWDMVDSGLRADLPMPGKLFKTGLQIKRENNSSGMRHILPIEATRKRRFIVPEYRKQQLNEAAKRLIYRIDNELDENSAISHLEYINRENAFKKRGGCLYTGHHLPKWSKDDPHIFFKNLEKYERSNANIYKEIEINLPNELTFDQQMEIVNEFLEKHFKNHYYAFAIHQKIGSLSEGTLHPHMHLMFCEREIDEIERENERSPQQFCKRYNPKNPEKGGCKKPAHWSGKYHEKKKYLLKIRKDCADIQNKILKKYGHNVTVDEKTLFAQRLVALEKGDLEKAEELNRPAEKTIPLAKAMNENSPEVKALKQFRSNKNKIKKNKNAINYLKNKNELDSVNEIIDQSSEQLSSIFQQDFSQELQNMASELKTYKELLSKQKDHVTDLIMEKADTETQKVWSDIKKLTSIKRLNTEIINDINYTNLHNAALEDNQNIDAKIKELAKKIRPFFQKQNNVNNLSELNKNNSKILESQNKIIHLKNNIQNKYQKHLTEKENITAKQLSLNELIRFISAELDKKQEELTAAEAQNDNRQKAFINEKRAYVMAQNVYTKGLLKKINSSIREQEKLLSRIEKLKDKRKSTLLHSEQMKIDNAIAKMESSYHERNIEIEQNKDLFNKMCSTENAKAKIKNITLGIIRKNKQQLKKITNTDGKILALQKEKMVLTNQQKKLHSLKEKYSDKSKFVLTDFNHPHLTHYPPQIRNEKGIIDALCGDVVTAALTMHIEENKKDWRFLSVFERERLMNKLD